MEGDRETIAAVRVHRLHWWKEAAIVAVFYVVYSWTRNQFGSNRIAADGVPEAAFNNAERVIRLERWMGLYHEETIQDIFLPYRWFIQFWNVYYGTAHFVVTLAVFILLYKKRADVFPQWRNTLAAMTAVAILGFAFFPLMPPRLLDAPCPEPGTTQYGGACVESELRPGPELKFNPRLGNGFGYVDTLSAYGGPWAFDSETVASVSNQYAAMPSMHIGWATWCALAVWPLLRRRWTKVLVLLYPLVTLFAIVVTANHFWIDGIGGLIAFAFGAWAGTAMHRWNQRRLDRRQGIDRQRRPNTVLESLQDLRSDMHGRLADEQVPADATADATADAGADPGSDGDADPGTGTVTER